jgi:hypothetical protein
MLVVQSTPKSFGSWVKPCFTRSCGPGWGESRQGLSNLGKIRCVKVGVGAEY